MKCNVSCIMVILLILMVWQIESTNMREKTKMLAQTKKIMKSLTFSRRVIQPIWSHIAKYILGDTFHYLYPGLSEVIDNDTGVTKKVLVLATTRGERATIISYVDLDVDYALLHVVNNNPAFFLYECSELLYTCTQYSNHLHKIRFYHLLFHELTKHCRSKQSPFFPLFHQFRQLIQTFTSQQLAGVLCAMKQNKQSLLHDPNPHQYLFFHVNFYDMGDKSQANTILALHESRIECSWGCPFHQCQLKKAEHAYHHWSDFTLRSCNLSFLAEILSPTDLWSNRRLYSKTIPAGEIAFNQSRAYIQLNAFLKPTTCWKCYWTKKWKGKLSVIIVCLLSIFLFSHWESPSKFFIGSFMTALIFFTFNFLLRD